MPEAALIGQPLVASGPKLTDRVAGSTEYLR